MRETLATNGELNDCIEKKRVYSRPYRCRDVNEARELTASRRGFL
jgi:hypothetical protein